MILALDRNKYRTVAPYPFSWWDSRVRGTHSYPPERRARGVLFTIANALRRDGKSKYSVALSLSDTMRISPVVISVLDRQALCHRFNRISFVAVASASETVTIRVTQNTDVGCRVVTRQKEGH